MRKTSNRKTTAIQRTVPASAQLAFRHILVPLDFSGFARQALTCAVPLARKHRAKISLVHIVPSPVALHAMPDGGLAMPVNLAKTVAVARKHLDELAARLLPRALRGCTVVREGNPTAEVVAAARTLKADLIVLSNTGRSGLRRVLLGSTAERIVRHAHCSVMTVHRRDSGAAMKLLALEKPLYPRGLPWRRILVPLDFSFTSLRALHVAVALARQSRARLELLNVVEANPYATGMEGAALVLPDAAIIQRVEAELPRIVRRFVPKSMKATTLVGKGRAADVIVATAEERGVDMIVLSTHGHTGMERLLMGSTAEQVVRHAQCPVFVVRRVWS